MHRRQFFLALTSLALLAACESVPAPDEFDVVIRNGTVFDGTGAEGVRADVGIVGDRIAAVGDLSGADAAAVVDASGQAVAPGFINMLSWANESLIHDGRSQSDIRQGVTLEVMGEGESMGPLSPALKAEAVKRQGDIKYDIAWTTLGEYLDFLERKGVSTNVASFIGAATVRANVVGFENRRATAGEMKRMQDLVRQAMREGAMGVGSSLIYAPGNFADTDELVALTDAAHGARAVGAFLESGQVKPQRLLLKRLFRPVRLHQFLNLPIEGVVKSFAGAAADDVTLGINEIKRRP